MCAVLKAHCSCLLKGIDFDVRFMSQITLLEWPVSWQSLHFYSLVENCQRNVEQTGLCFLKLLQPKITDFAAGVHVLNSVSLYCSSLMKTLRFVKTLS